MGQKSFQNGTCAVQPAFISVSATLMKAWSVLGLLVGAAMFAAVPISPQNQAQAILGHWRRVNRRVYRRAYRRGYYYGGYGGYGAPYYYGAYRYGGYGYY
jgi:hypothetical protein